MRYILQVIAFLKPEQGDIAFLKPAVFAHLLRGFNNREYNF